MEIPDVLWGSTSIVMELDKQIKLGHLLLSDRKCRICGEEEEFVRKFL